MCLPSILWHVSKKHPRPPRAYELNMGEAPACSLLHLLHHAAKVLPPEGELHYTIPGTVRFKAETTSRFPKRKLRSTHKHLNLSQTTPPHTTHKRLSLETGGWGEEEKQNEQKTTIGPRIHYVTRPRHEKVELTQRPHRLTKPPPLALLQVVVATAKKRVLKRWPARSSKGGFRDPARRSRRRSRKFPELSRRGVRRASTARACPPARSC